MKTKLTIKGIKEEQKNLLQMPNRMAASALSIVNQRARETATEIRRAYPRKTGALRAGVRVERGKKTGAKRTAVAAARIVSSAPHAHLIEHGTAARHTSLGAEFGDRGMMYGLNVFWPRVLRVQNELRPQFAAIMRAEGLTVKGA